MTDPVLNELSFQVSALNRAIAREWMKALVAAIAEATASGLKRTLRCPLDFETQVLAREYTIAMWRNDREVDQITQTFFRRLATNYQQQQGLEEFLLDTEYRFGGQISTGLATALLLDTIAFSIPGDVRWSAFSLEVLRIGFDEQGEFRQSLCSVRHASSAADVRQHLPWFEERKRQSASDGKTLYERRTNLLPRLVFSQEATRQLQDLSETHIMFKSAKGKLFEFDRYARNWDHGRFEPDKLPFKVSPESAETLKKYAGSRSFRFDAGVTECSWHARLTPGAWRIHFSWNEADRTILIGYIGPKLPTMLYAT